jgi:hypothetical protein
MDGLHGGYQIQLCSLLDIIGVEQLKMFYAVLEMRQGMAFFVFSQHAKAVEHFMSGTVPDGVYSQADAVTGGFYADLKYVICAELKLAQFIL